VTQSRTSSNDHARHDRLIVVRYLDLDDDLLASEVDQARSLLASCPDCAALGTELQLISDATNRMSVPSRPRDFRLTPQQAAQLRPGGLRRFVEGFGGAFRFEFLRPLAGAAVAIGLLLAVVGFLPGFRPSGATDSSLTGGSERTAAQLASIAPDAATNAAPVAMAPATPDGRDTQSPEFGASVAPVVGASSSAPGQLSQPTDKNSDATALPSSVELSGSPAPAATDASKLTGPGATGTTTAYAAGSAGAAPPQNGGAGSIAESSENRDAIPPLVILGVLLASVGLVVVLLTFVSRRIGRSAG
jgi:hypothetical protein